MSEAELVKCPYCGPDVVGIRYCNTCAGIGFFEDRRVQERRAPTLTDGQREAVKAVLTFFYGSREGKTELWVEELSRHITKLRAEFISDFPQDSTAFPTPKNPDKEG